MGIYSGLHHRLEFVINLVPLSQMAASVISLMSNMCEQQYTNAVKGRTPPDWGFMLTKIPLLLFSHDRVQITKDCQFEWNKDTIYFHVGITLHFLLPIPLCF